MFARILIAFWMLCLTSGTSLASGPGFNDTTQKPLALDGSGRLSVSGDTSIGAASLTYATTDPDLFVKGNIETDANVYATGASANYFAKNVGIGTTSSATQLQVRTAANVDTMVRVSSSTAVNKTGFEILNSWVYSTVQAGWYLYPSNYAGNNAFGESVTQNESVIVPDLSTNSPLKIGTATNIDNVYIYSNSLPRMTITGLVGNVGLGTTTPAAKLEVDGAVYAPAATGVMPSHPQVSLSTAGNAMFGGNVEIDGLVYIDGALYGDGTHLTGIALGTPTMITQNDTTAAIADGTSTPISFSIDGSKSMVLDANGNVGIGTPAPLGKLHVEANRPAGLYAYFNNTGSGDTVVGIGSGLSGSPVDKGVFLTASYSTNTFIIDEKGDPNSRIAFKTCDAGSVSIERMRIDENGNVGIGTVSPSTSLDIAGGTLSHADGAGGDLLVKSDIEADGQLYIDGTGNNYFAGNVGVGSTVPRSKLQVDGAIYIGTTAPSHAQTALGTSGNAMFGGNVEIDGLIYIDGALYGDGSHLTGVTVSTPTMITQNDTTVVIADGTSTPISFSIDGSKSMILDANGNVGIGTTSPGFPLVVNQGVSNSTTVAQFGTGDPLYLMQNYPAVGFNAFYDGTKWVYGASSGSHAAYIMQDSTTGMVSFFTSSITGASGSAITGNTALVLTKGANAGIGTTTPAARLEVDGAIYAAAGVAPSHAQVSLATAGNAMFGGNVEIDGLVYIDGALYGNGSGLTGITGQVTGLSSNSVPRASSSTVLVDSGIYALANGNVGIGSASPKGALDVAGDIYAGAPAVTYATTNPDLFVKGNIETDSNLYATGAGFNYFAGSVGIGTTSTSEALLVLGNGMAFSNATITGAAYNGIKINTSNADTAAVEFWATTRSLYLYRQTDDSFRINMNGSGDAFNFTTAGRLGIGTTGPYSKLQVDGAIYAGTTAPSHAQVSMATSGDAMFGGNVEIDGLLYIDGALYGDGSHLTGVATTMLTQNDTTVAVADGTSTPISFSIDGSKSMVLDANGNVGIGTTAPVKKLEVKGGDMYINNAGGQLIMKKPDGTCASCGVDNSDVWVCSSMACP